MLDKEMVCFANLLTLILETVKELLEVQLIMNKKLNELEDMIAAGNSADRSSFTKRKVKQWLKRPTG